MLISEHRQDPLCLSCHLQCGGAMARSSKEERRSQKNTSVHTKLTADIRTQHARIFLDCKFSISGRALQPAAFKMLPLYLDIHTGCSEEL